MCFFNSPKAPEPAPPPAAPPAAAPVMTNMYDPSAPEAGLASDKLNAGNAASGTSQLMVDLDPTVANMDSGTGLQINQ